MNDRKKQEQNTAAHETQTKDTFIKQRGLIAKNTERKQRKTKNYYAAVIP